MKIQTAYPLTSTTEHRTPVNSIVNADDHAEAVTAAPSPKLSVAGEQGPEARSERIKLLPLPRPLKHRQIRALTKLVRGTTQATDVMLVDLTVQIAEMSRNFDLHNQTRVSLELLALDLDGFLQRFDPTAPLRCSASTLWLRNALDEIISLQCSPDVAHLPFRMFNATLIAVALEIIRGLDLQLAPHSVAGNPAWQQEAGTPALRRVRIAARTSVTLAQRLEWRPAGAKKQG